MKWLKCLHLSFAICITHIMSVYADTAIVVNELDYGQVMITTPTNSAVLAYNYSGIFQANKSSNSTAGNAKRAGITYTNTDTTNKRIYISHPTSTTLTCNSDTCSPNCSITLTKGMSNTNNTNINSNSSYTFYQLMATVTIPANCGTGLFTGTETVGLLEL